MPHINMKFYASSLTPEQQSLLTTELTKVVANITGCNENVVSIALEPIEKSLWYEKVYQPEMMDRKELISKFPNYSINV